MGYTKGHVKVPNSGRQKGTLNKATMEKSSETFQRLNFDPLERLIRLVRKKDTHPELKVRALVEMLKYRHPRLANMTITADVTSTISLERINVLATDPATAAAMEAIAIALLSPPPDRRALPPGDVIDVTPEPEPIHQ